MALAHGTAKDRKVLLRVFRDTVDMMAFDPNAKMVLIAGLDIPDDTTMTTKAIYRDLLGEKLENKTERFDKMEQIVTDLNARMPILYPLAGPAKWLMNPQDKALLDEMHTIRQNTSKKAPEVRRKGLVDYMSDPLLELVTERASNLVLSTGGCQFISETLLEANGSNKDGAKAAVAELASGDPTSEEHIANSPAAGRMLKSLVLGGSFDPATKTVKLAEPRLGFAGVLWPVIKDHVLDWACSASSFVVVALTESEDVEQDVRKEVLAALKKGKKQLENAAKGKGEEKGNAGARMLVGKIA